jgi:hypothetical protein
MAVRWSYKTVHFGLKKDGLLGGSFLDDAEIEETLNEYGQGGWELVSMFETRDGVIAVFKQHLDLEYVGRPASETESEVGREPFVPRKTFIDPEPEDGPEPTKAAFREKKGVPVATTYRSSRPEYQDDEEVEENSDSGIGSIRIE